MSSTASVPVPWSTAAFMLRSPPLERTLYIITAIYLRGGRKSGGGSEGPWKIDVAEGEHGGHEAVATRSDTIEAGAGDLGNEAVAAKLGDEARGALATPADVGVAVRGVRVEERGEIAVTKAVEEVASVEGGGEESSVVGRDRIEAGDALVADGAAKAQAVELGDGLVCGLDVGESFEKAGVGALAELVEAPEVGHALGHTHPPQRALDPSQGLELARVVNGGLDAQDAPLVVHLDGVALHAKLDPKAFGAALEIDVRLALAVAVC